MSDKNYQKSIAKHIMAESVTRDARAIDRLLTDSGEEESHEQQLENHRNAIVELHDQVRRLEYAMNRVLTNWNYN